MKVAFNTGAFYTQEGQRIAAWTDTKLNVACFVDFDRGIYEYFPFTMSGQFSSPLDFARHVMHMYDWGQYRSGGHIAGLREILSDVYRHGYDAFKASDEVHVIGYRKER